MNAMPWFKTVVLGILAVLALSGCQQNVVYQRSISELNQKAQALMQAGDVNGAVARLESAHDLQPDEPNTTYNLAVAYQAQGQYDKALPLLIQLQKQGGIDANKLYTALGVTYEAKADKLEFDAKTLADDPKADQSQTQPLKDESLKTYQLALEAYQQALPGAKDPGTLKKQIEALETKLRNPEGTPLSEG